MLAMASTPLTVEVERDRILKVRGSDALPYTGGVICNKVARYSAEFVHGAGRLHWPLRRIGPRGSGRFERIGWDEALDEIRQRVTGVIERFGSQAVIPLNYSGPHGMLSMDSMSLRFFHRLGASQLYRRALCGAFSAVIEWLRLARAGDALHDAGPQAWGSCVTPRLPRSTQKRNGRPTREAGAAIVSGRLCASFAKGRG